MTIKLQSKIIKKETGTPEETKKIAISLAKENSSVAAEIEGKFVIKELYVPKKLVNIVVK